MQTLTRNLTMVLAATTLLGAAACGPGGDDTAGACADILPGELVITEVFADHDAPAGSSGADEGKEWFEIYNASGAPIDLAGLTVLHSRPDGSSDHTHTIEATTLAAGDYLVLGNVLPEFVAAHLDYGYGDDLGDLFNSGSGKLSIGCGGDVIDEALYEEPALGKSIGFDGGAAPDYTANDDLTAWCHPPEEAAFEFESANFGTPGSTNYDCDVVVAGMCDDGGTMRPAVTPAAGDLILTELHPNPSGDDALQEWFEVYATRDVDLNGLGIARTVTTTPNVVTSSSCLRVTAGSYAVIARSAVPEENGGLPAVTATYGAISLVDAGDLQIMIGTTVLDSFAWSNAPSAATLGLDPDFQDASTNDQERYWCAATTAWAAGDRGSPGAANEQCTILPPPGQCEDPDDTTERAIVVPTAGQITITEWMPNPSEVVDTRGEWFEVRANAAVDLNGLQGGLLTLGSNPLIVSATCVELEAGEYVLLARNGDDTLNGGLPVEDGTFTFDLPNNSMAAIGNLRVGVGGVELDAVTWATNTAGLAIQKDTDGTQCNVPVATPLYNATDRGTPRAVHSDECP